MRCLSECAQPDKHGGRVSVFGKYGVVPEIIGLIRNEVDIKDAYALDLCDYVYIMIARIENERLMNDKVGRRKNNR